MKNENEAEATSTADLIQLAVRDSLEVKSRKRDDLLPDDLPAKHRPEALKLKKLRALHEAFDKKKAEGLNWRKIAKLAALDLKAFSDEIFLAARTGQKGFFLDLGKCLLGRIKSGYDKRDVHIAVILSHNPSIKVKDAVRELEKLGWHMTEDHFRNRKKLLKDLGRAVHEGRKAHEAQIDEWVKGTLQLLEKKRNKFRPVTVTANSD